MASTVSTESSTIESGRKQDKSHTIILYNNILGHAQQLHHDTCVEVSGNSLAKGVFFGAQGYVDYNRGKKVLAARTFSKPASLQD